MRARTSPIFAESHKKRRFYWNHYAHYEQSSLWLYEIIKLAKPRAHARTGWILLFIACTKCSFSQCCVVIRRDNIEFIDAIKKGCLACVRVLLRKSFFDHQLMRKKSRHSDPFLGFKSHSMQPQGLELMRLSLANIELVKKIIQFSTVFSTIFYGFGRSQNSKQPFCIIRHSVQRHTHRFRLARQNITNKNY